MSEKAKLKMQLAIALHGKEKEKCTKAIKILQSIEKIKNHPTIVDAIEILKCERDRLNKISALD
jgi:hypothetical protein